MKDSSGWQSDCRLGWHRTCGRRYWRQGCITRHAEPHGRVRLQECELDSIGATLRIGGGSDLAYLGCETAAGQPRKGDARGLPGCEPAEIARSGVQCRVNCAAPCKTVDGLAG